MISPLAGLFTCTLVMFVGMEIYFHVKEDKFNNRICFVGAMVSLFLVTHFT